MLVTTRQTIRFHNPHLKIAKKKPKNLKLQIQSIHLHGNITHMYEKLQTFLTVVSNVTPCNA